LAFPLIRRGCGAVPLLPEDGVAGEEFTVEVRGAFDDVEDTSAVRYNSLEGALRGGRGEARCA